MTTQAVEDLNRADGAMSSVEASPDRTGLYPIRSVDRVGDAVIFDVPGGFLDVSGFAYLPDGPAAEDWTFARHPTFRRARRRAVHLDRRLVIDGERTGEGR